MGEGQVWVGAAFMLAGAGLLSFLNVVSAIYGGVLFVIGVFLVIYRNADKEIEQIKDEKKEVKKK